MKTKAITISSIISMTVLLCACGNNETKEHDHESHEHHDEENSPESAREAGLISPIVRHYIHLKNALVSASLDETKSGAKGMLDEINKMDVSKFTPEQKAVWDEQIAMIKENVQHMAEAPEVSHQREHLNPLSEAMLTLVKTFGGGETLYYEFCPMANDNKGGYWLSESKEIKNPYFGDEMLQCGEVKETLK